MNLIMMEVRRKDGEGKNTTFKFLSKFDNADHESFFKISKDQCEGSEIN